jgi:hypothetical protein
MWYDGSVDGPKSPLLAIELILTGHGIDAKANINLLTQRRSLELRVSALEAFLQSHAMVELLQAITGSHSNLPNFSGHDTQAATSTVSRCSQSSSFIDNPIALLI